MHSLSDDESSLRSFDHPILLSDQDRSQIHYQQQYPAPEQPFENEFVNSAIEMSSSSSSVTRTKRKGLLSRGNRAKTFLGGMSSTSNSMLSPDEETKILDEFDRMRQIMREQKGKIYEGSFAPENRNKNRYRDVLPFEDTRVKLDPVEGEAHSDYINANIVQGEAKIAHHVDGDKVEPTAQHYICCQAPLPNTFYDFWRMIWQYRCPVIVMLTKLEEKNRRKAHAYWPREVGATESFCDLHVTLKMSKKLMDNIDLRVVELRRTSPTRVSSFTGYELQQDDSITTPDHEATPERAFNDFPGGATVGLNHCSSSSSSSSSGGGVDASGRTSPEDDELNSPPLTVAHLHYTEWPDFGIPASTDVMRELIKELDIRKKGPKDPIVVHCSAGIGRAGTFLAIHISLQKHLTNPDLKISVKDTVLKLRQQRHGMVQSKDQYKFVYATLKEALQDRSAPITGRGLPSNRSLTQSSSQTGQHSPSEETNPKLEMPDTPQRLKQSRKRSSSGKHSEKSKTHSSDPQRHHHKQQQAAQPPSQSIASDPQCTTSTAPSAEPKDAATPDVPASLSSQPSASKSRKRSASFSSVPIPF